MMDLYFKMLLSLFFVLALIGVFYLLIKKRLNVSSSSGLFQVLEYKSFGPKSGIMALKFGDKVLLLAITPTNITMIEQFDSKNIIRDDEKKDDLIEKVKRLKDNLNELN